MGRVIAIDRWLEDRGREHEQAEAFDVARLERAVAKLEPLLEQATQAGIQLETELLAVSGAVSLGLFDEAARRAERLADRLAKMTARRRQRG
jgi:hypothetical protein